MLTGRDEKALEETAASIRAKGSKAAISQLDLRETDAPDKLIAAVKRDFGALDILINNAGTTKRGDFFALTEADWEEGYALKFFAHVRLSRAAWPLLKERKGSLVAIGGTSGRKPHATFTIGSSVNAAVAAFTKCLADLGKEDGVQVNCIHPSLVETERQWRRIRAEIARTGAPEDKVRAALAQETGITRFGTVEDVADLVTFIVSQRATWLHGATIDLDGGEIPVL
jgi:3-oxoacyl-[acyl-carrier protein] reductase